MPVILSIVLLIVILFSLKGANIYRKTKHENAWKNPALLKSLEEKNVYPPISQSNLNLMLADAAEYGDVWTVEYALKRGAEVNSYQLAPEHEEELKKNVHKQTPLIKNAIRGYFHYGYANNGKAQVSPRVAEILLKAGADPNMADSEGKTALHYVSGMQGCYVNAPPEKSRMSRFLSSIFGEKRDRNQLDMSPVIPPLQYHDSIAQLLVNNGAGLNIRDNDGNTSLMLAIKSRNDAVLRMLLDAKADITIKDNEGKDAFSYSEDLTSLRIIKEAGLLKHVTQERIDVAFDNFFTGHYSHEGDWKDRNKYDIESLKALVGHGINVNMRLYGGRSMTAMEYAFDRIYGEDRFKIAQALIDGGFDLYEEDNSYTMLMNMIRKSGDDKIDYSNLLFLIKNGIDLNYKSKFQYTALGIAMCEEKKEAADFLIKHGAKRDLESEWWYLVKRFNPNENTILKLQKLVEEGVDVNMKAPVIMSDNIQSLKQEGVTALMIYSGENQSEGVTALIKMGAKVNLKTANGATALDIAKAEHNNSVINILLQVGAK